MNPEPTHREASDAPMSYTVSKSKEFEVLRKRLEDTELQLDRALVFARGVQRDSEVGKIAPSDAETAYQQTIRAE
jgi:hypothetical protein